MHHPSHRDDFTPPADNTTDRAWATQWTVDIWGPRKGKAPRPPRGGEQR